MKRVAFVIAYPFQFFVLHPIYKALEEEAEFIVDLGAYFPVAQPGALEKEIVELLKRNGVPYRVLSLDDYRYPDYLKKFFADTTAIVSLWERGVVSLACNLEKIKIQVTYGAGKELNMVRPSRALFDVILSYGPRDHALASMYTTSVIVGNPKFDPWFNGTIPSLPVNISRSIRPQKKTVVYLPTHGDLSSIDTIAPQLHQLTEEYNVIAKPHYLSLREETKRVDMLSGGTIAVVDDSIDLLSLLAVADVVVSDNSSVIFDAILADIPLVVADFWDAKKLDVDHRTQPYLRRGRTIPVTYSGSIEQEIKRTGKVVTFSRADEMKEKIDEALKNDLLYKEKRKKIRDELFAFNDGACAERAAHAIQEFCKNPIRERPIMYHALEAFKENIGALSFARRRRLERACEILKEKRVTEITSHHVPLFTVAVFSRGETASERTRAIRALFSQSFPLSHVQYVFYGVTKTDIEECVGGSKEKLLYRVEVAQGPACEYVSHTLEVSQSELYAFTTLEHMVPANWLLLLWDAYERNPDTYGVGGVSGFERGNKHPLQSTALRSVQRQWGVKNVADLYVTSSSPTNPVGGFSGVSYKRTVLESLQKKNLCQSLDILEEQIKVRVMTMGNVLTFIPVFPVLLTKQSLKRYILSMVRKGYIGYIHEREYPAQSLHSFRVTKGLILLAGVLFARPSQWHERLVDAVGDISGGIGNLVGMSVRIASKIYPKIYTTQLLVRLCSRD